MSKRPALSNLVVCAVFKLREDHPEVFQAMGQDACEDGKVSSYDVLSTITGRSFEDCFTAVQKAEETGLVDAGSDLTGGYLTLQGREFMDSIPLDVLQLCRDGSSNLSHSSRDKVLKIIDHAYARLDAGNAVIASTRMDDESIEVEVDPSLDPDFDDLDFDDEVPAVQAPRRPTSKV